MSDRLSYRHAYTCRPPHTYYVTVVVFVCLYVRTTLVGINNHEFMDRACNLTDLYKVNVNCEFKVKCLWKILIFEVKFMLCDSMYRENTQRKPKKCWMAFSPVSKFFSKQE